MLAYNQQLGHDRTVTSLKMGIDKQSYYSASSDGSVLKWNLKNPRALPEVVFDSDEIVRSIDISPDGKWMMLVFYQTGLQLISLDPNTVEDVVAVRDPEPVQMAVFMPEEQQYLSVTKNQQLIIKGFKEEPREIGQTRSQVFALEVATKDGTIYAGTLDGVIESWENQEYFGYDLGRPAITCMDISPDGQLLAIGRDKGDVVLWNILERELERMILGHSSTVTDIQFSPDGNL
ncbi:MAG: WD40 repeat domain-containing protein [Cytophagales bacterium]|nr:WD40 repeat domain-containing protein [Cytophagales bacterium]